MKQTFEIPEGCKVVTVEQIGNQLITSFEPEKYEPKVGDCVKRTTESGSIVFGVIMDSDCNLSASVDSEGAYYEQWFCFGGGKFEKLTPEEFQAEFEKLGYVYDFETHTAHEKRWRAEDGEDYSFVTGVFEIQTSTDIGHRIDDLHYKAGNYFKNEEDAEPYRDYMLQHSLNFHKK